MASEQNPMLERVEVDERPWDRSVKRLPNQRKPRRANNRSLIYGRKRERENNQESGTGSKSCCATSSQEKGGSRCCFCSSLCSIDLQQHHYFDYRRSRWSYRMGLGG